MGSGNVGLSIDQAVAACHTPIDERGPGCTVDHEAQRLGLTIQRERYRRVAGVGKAAANRGSKVRRTGNSRVNAEVHWRAAAYHRNIGVDTVLIHACTILAA